ncbi:MAG: molybdopterin converting factor subunit 1 [Limnobacter sp.]|nr:molybdopterin converting factor subunit 1 [Limnobacter sp.]
MNITVRFFASLKEQMGVDRLQLDTAFEPRTVAGLKAFLCVHNAQFGNSVQQIGRIRAAVNQDMADEDTAIPAAAEVAFFPPVTGG